MKAILIIDMPECCISCPCYDMNGPDGLCWAKERRVRDDFKKPSWCPLKPLPKKEPEYFISSVNGEKVHDAYFQGWNDCLDVITGGRK